MVAALRAAVFDSPGETEPRLRSAAATGAELPEPWSAYPEKVRDQSYRVTDADVARLPEAGRTEDEIFELTVAAAVGAALHSLDAGERVLRESVMP